MCSGIVDINDYSDREAIYIAAAHHAKQHGDNKAYKLYTTRPNIAILSTADQGRLKAAVAKMQVDPEFQKAIIKKCELSIQLSKNNHEKSVAYWDNAGYKHEMKAMCKRKGRDKYHAIWLALTFHQFLQYPEWTTFGGCYAIPQSRFSEGACAMRWEYFGGMGEKSNYSDERLIFWMGEALAMAGLESAVNPKNPKAMAAAALMALDIPLSAVAQKVADQVIHPMWNAVSKKDWTHHLLGKEALKALEESLIPVRSTIAKMQKLSAISGVSLRDLVNHGLRSSIIADTVITKLRGVNGLTRPTSLVLEFLGEPIFHGIDRVFPSYRSSIQLNILNRQIHSQLSIFNKPSTNTALKQTFIEEALKIRAMLLKPHSQAGKNLLALAAESESATWTALTWKTATTPAKLLMAADTASTEAPAPAAVTGAGEAAAGAGSANPRHTEYYEGPEPA